MKKLLFSIIVLLAYNYALSCNYTVDLNDTYGDGWNGNSITISVNGIPVLTAITVDDPPGDVAQFNFFASPGDNVSITYDNSGSYDYENEITITSDDLGTVIFTDGMGGEDPTGGSFTVAVDCGIAPPSNDEPCTAINLPMNGICNPIAGSVDGASTSPIPNPSCGTFTSQSDVWFETTVGASGLLQIDLTDGGIDANMAIYEGPTCSNLNEIGCSVNNTFYSDIIAPGTQLWVRVWDENNSTGSFSICASEPPAPPTNNDPCSAEPILVNSTCIPTIGTTSSAINSNVLDPTCSWNYQGGDVWYTATVPSSGFMNITLNQGGLTDGGIALYSGSDCNSLTEVNCEESTYAMPDALIVTPSDELEDQQVWIRVWEGENNNPGSFEICLFEDTIFFVDTTLYTPQELVEDVLVTGCIETFNVEYTGRGRALGFFNAEGINFDFGTGIILTTGDATLAMGENNSGGTGAYNDDWSNPATDPDLEALSNVNIRDAAILEFDFVPSSDTIRFKYVFASEEYDEYVCATVNDAFGFFISGPGINGPYLDNAINIALIPGTNVPVSINTVNNGNIGSSGSASNCDGGSDYYLGNSEYFQNDPYASDIQYDGFTAVLEAVAVLQACETYHIKLKIGDGGDSNFDSAVMFEANSFSSGGSVSMSSNSTAGSTNDIYEGCENYYVFSRLDTSELAMQTPLDIILDVSGTAIEGVDYTSIPDTLTILPGETEYTLYYSAIFDDIDEADEYIIFSLLSGCTCSLTATNDTIWIKNNYHLNATISEPPTICIGDSAQIITSVNPNIDPLLISYTWSTSDTTSSIYASPNITTDYYVTITNSCEDDGLLNSSIEVIPTIDPNFTLSRDTACIGEAVNITFSGSTTSMASFDWSFNGATPATANTMGPYSVSWTSIGPKTIDLFINDQGCLNDTTLEIYIKEFSNMSLSTNNSNANCNIPCGGIGTVVANTGTAPFSYLWQDGQELQSATNLCPGPFSVTVSDVYGCKDTTHVFIPEPSNFTYTFETDSTSCFGYNDGAAFVTTIGGTTPFTYLWSDNSTEQNIVNANANTYSVTITDAMGCQKIESNIIIEQPSEVSANIYGNSYVDGEIWICIGETETLNSSATGGIAPYNFVWNTGISSNQISVNPQETTMYSARATDSHGCLSPVKTVILNVYDPISIEISPNSQEICRGEVININIDAQGGNGEYIYQINSSNGTETVESSFSISPEQTQDYIISTSDNCNSPTGESSFSVTVHPSPEVSFHANTGSGCQPLEVDFIETSNTNNNSYIWEFIDSNLGAVISLDRNPSYIFNDEGAYHIKLKVKSDNDCQSELTKYNYITVFPKPIAKFTPQPAVTSIIKPIIYFNNESSDADTYYWSFGDSDSSLQVTPEHTYPSWVSEYNIELIASNRFGCSDRINHTVEIVDEITLHPPTAFSPNGDELNETFSIPGNGILPENFTFIIYDRWGMEIFRTNNINEGWTGRLDSGDYVKSGLYLWLLKYTDVNHIPHERSGQVNVLK